jgi:hypothetical protein
VLEAAKYASCVKHLDVKRLANGSRAVVLLVAEQEVAQVCSRKFNRCLERSLTSTSSCWRGRWRRYEVHACLHRTQHPLTFHKGGGAAAGGTGGGAGKLQRT